MDVRHRRMADTFQIEREIVSGGQTAQCVHRRCRDDCAAWRWGARIVHDNGIRSRPGIIRDHA